MGPWKRVAVLLLLTALASICIRHASPQPQASAQTSGPAPGQGAGAHARTPPAGGSEAQHMRWLAAHIETLIHERPALAGARIGILIQDLESDRILYERAAEETYNVASNAKIITSAAALALLGPDFRYRTALLAEEVDARGVVTGDLYLQSRGDPTITTAVLRALADELVAAGIEGVRGDLVVDDSYFDDQISPPHFDEQPGEQAAFRAPVGAVSLERSAYTVVVRPARAGTGPAEVWIEPANAYVRLARAQVVTQKSGRHRVLVDSKVAGDHLDVVVSGQVRADAGLLRFRRRVDDPRAYAGETLRALLKERGIRVQRPVRPGQAPAKARLLAHVDSEPMSVLVRALGKQSDNFVAEVLLKTIAAEAEGARGQIAAPAAGGAHGADGAHGGIVPAAVVRPATWAAGTRAVSDFLLERIGLPAGSFRYGNGSGLFGASEISPAQLVAVLAAAHRDMSYGPDLVASLAIAGVDGTLRRRMVGTLAERRVRAKTGTLATVSALGGYAAAVDGRHPAAFAIFVNDIAPAWAARQQAVSLQDAIAEALVGYLGSPRQAAPAP